MIEIDDRYTITLGEAWGLLVFTDGSWRYTRRDGVTKVYRWDGRRWRRVRRPPEHVRHGLGLLP